MKIQFEKYQGCGNDFVIIDNSKSIIELSLKQIKNICDRRYGIGADGLLEIIEYQKDIIKMNYYNSDGKISSLCGNGSRCALAYCFNNMYINNQCTIMTGENYVRGNVMNDDENLKFELFFDNISNISKHQNSFVIDTGSPHYVKISTNINDIDFLSFAKKIRFSKDFPQGINVNLVEIISKEVIRVRTYERGVEDETYSCGTGVVASALVYSKIFGTSSNLNIKTKGGDFFVNYDNDSTSFKNVKLTADAKLVFKGEINL